MQQVTRVLLPRLKVLRHYLKQESAFTLLESLLVLFCISIVLSLTFPIFVNRLDHSMYEQAIQKFYMTMYEAQLIAEVNGLFTEIMIQEGNIVTVMLGEEEVISTWELPPDMSIRISAFGRRIRYTEKGIISKPGSIVFETPKETKEYSITFTYGRMREK